MIAKIEGREVADLDGFRSAIAAVEHRERFLITALRGDERVLLLVRPGGSATTPSAPAGPAGQSPGEGPEPGDR